MRFAVVHNGAVENVIEAPEFFSIPWRILVEAPEEVAVGWTFDGDQFAPPAPVGESVRFVAPYDFRLLFTTQERLAIYGSTDGVVRDFLGALQTMIGPVDLQDLQTTQGVGYLAMSGLIAPERVEQILSGSPPQ